MRRATRLSTLRMATMCHLARLRTDAAAVGPGHPVRHKELCVANATIQLLNLWANFVRAYYLSCMLGAKREGGGWVATAHPGLTVNQALGMAILLFKPRAQPSATGGWDRRQEPTWHDPNNFLKIAAAVNCAHLADIQAAFSTGTRVFHDLPVFRNYFAHRNQQTSAAAVALAPLYGIPSTRRPSQVLLSRPIRRPQPLLLEWMDEMQFTIEYLCH